MTVQDQDMYSKVTKFPHHIEYLIGCSTDAWAGGEEKLIIYGGNNQGEVYIYEMTDKNKVDLVDMIMISQPTIVRNSLRVS